MSNMFPLSILQATQYWMWPVIVSVFLLNVGLLILVTCWRQTTTKQIRTDTGSTKIHHMQPFVLVTMTVCLLTALLVLVLLILICKTRKNNKDVEENVPMMEMKLFIAVIKDGKQPSLETKEAITVHQPTNDSDANIELQTLQPSTLYPMLEKAAMLCDHQKRPSSETMKGKDIQELHQVALCKICLVKEMSMVFMPCSHSVTCANCSISLKQCPGCSVLIKMKIIICSD